MRYLCLRHFGATRSFIIEFGRVVVSKVSDACSAIPSGLDSPSANNGTRGLGRAGGIA